MTVTFIDPSGEQLADRLTRRRFTATDPVAYISVRFFDAAHPGLQRPEEVVYRDGAYRYPYSIASTVAGTSYTVVRQGGWTDNLELHVEEQHSSAPAAPTPAVLPAGYLGSIAQYDLLLVNGTLEGTDRSGNSRHLGNVNPQAMPDLIPGRASLAPIAYPGVYLEAGLNQYPALSIPSHGAMTACVRFAYAPYNHVGQAAYMFLYSDWTTGDEVGAAQYALGLSNNGTSIFYYSEHSYPKVGGAFGFNPVAPPGDGLERFACLRRDASGTSITIDVDGESATGTAPAPTGGSYARLRIGRDTTTEAFPRGQNWNGKLAVFGLWDYRMTDAQVLDVRKRMMGLP
jgi:hypothetical protein